MPRSVFTDAYASFLSVLIAARKRAGVSQIDLAARIGKTQSFVSSFERGVRRLDVIEFCAIARALGRDPIDLFREVAERLPAKIEM